MKVVAVCGPHGALLAEYVQRVKEKVGAATVIDESKFISGDFKVNEEKLLTAITDAKKVGLVIVYGHYLYSNESIRKACDVRLWMETEKDICLINYLKSFDNVEENTQAKIMFYEETLKVQNEKVILPSKKNNYHMGIQKINEQSVAVIVNSLKPVIPRDSLFASQSSAKKEKTVTSNTFGV